MATKANTGIPPAERARLAAFAATVAPDDDVEIPAKWLTALLAACDAAERERDEAEQRARDAYRRGAAAMREAAVATVYTVNVPQRFLVADAIAALPITDAEEM